MNLSEAMEVIGIEDITNETEESIKKKYKKLMIKYHPDNRGGDDTKAKELSLAIEVLRDAIKNIARFKALNRVSTQLTIVIPMNKLINIYSGGKLTMKAGNEQYEIGRKEIQKYSTFIISDASITHNGITYDFSNIQPWTINDKYEINCDIYVDDITKEEVVNIRVEDYNKQIRFKSQSVVIGVTLKYNINVALRITKKTIDKKE